MFLFLKLCPRIFENNSWIFVRRNPGNFGKKPSEASKLEGMLQNQPGFHQFRGEIFQPDQKKTIARCRGWCNKTG